MLNHGKAVWVEDASTTKTGMVEGTAKGVDPQKHVEMEIVNNIWRLQGQNRWQLFNIYSQDKVGRVGTGGVLLLLLSRFSHVRLCALEWVAIAFSGTGGQSP